MTEVWGVALVALGGLLVGGAVSAWKSSRALAAALAVCALPAAGAGALHLGYFGG
ncbi:hypothetical protein [Streptomonospora salina]|uniref:Putative regulator of Ras-like GTPase activity (Roadblock/LC7/MglB family) n=1 Tax=Streptomonospora salina TaxID=104205 RepID=A0A841E6D9_9ACTN|nr:hypothetical protein [Streptomonospora salina]MBB5996713.1 putative regulator of Ras-like GTPase activity (Roadblock/LC7/MglB family) [Streptomonospora salina]